MAERWLDAVQESYDADAAAYADQVQGLLEANPYLRAGLGLFAELVDEAGGGPVADIGCGPGYVTRHLRSLGSDAFGIDLSPEMVAIARRDHPEIRFESTRVASAGQGRVAVTGRATIRGVTREVTLDAVLYRPPGSDPGARDDLTVLITGTISRAAFGASGHAGSVGDTVRLRILLHVRRAG